MTAAVAADNIIIRRQTVFHDLSDRMRAGETLIGTWLYQNDIATAEIVAGGGYDFVMIDMEHSSTGFENLHRLVMALEHHTAPMVRIKAGWPEFITAILDQGPAGIMMPWVNTVEQAKRAVQCAKYHPIGLRGIGPYRVSDYSRRMAEVFEKANEKQMLWVQIEQAEALKNLNQIVKVPGIDAFFIGRGDLSQSMGHLNDANHPEVTAAARQALDTIRKEGLPAGSAFDTYNDSEQLKMWHEAGMRIFTVGADFAFLIHGMDKSLSEAKKALSL